MVLPSHAAIDLGSPSFWWIVVGGGLTRAPFGIWFAWLYLDGALYSRFENDIKSIKLLRLAQVSCLALVLSGSLAPVRPLQRLVGHRWACSLGAAFSGIGLTASALSVNVWQFLVASGVVVALGGALTLSPPLCLGFFHHPSRKAAIVGSVNAGIVLTTGVAVALSTTWLEPWFGYTGNADDGGDPAPPDCSGRLSSRVDICARVPFSLAILGLFTTALGFLGAWCLPRSRPPSRGGGTAAERVASTSKYVGIAGAAAAAAVRAGAGAVDDTQSQFYGTARGGDDDEDAHSVSTTRSASGREGNSNENPAANGVVGTRGGSDRGGGGCEGEDWESVSMSGCGSDEASGGGSRSSVVSRVPRPRQSLMSAAEGAAPLPARHKPYKSLLPWLIVVAHALTLAPPLVVLLTWDPATVTTASATADDDDGDGGRFSLTHSAAVGQFWLLCVCVGSGPLLGAAADAVTGLARPMAAAAAKAQRAAVEATGEEDEERTGAAAWEGLVAAPSVIASVWCTLSMMLYSPAQRSGSVGVFFAASAFSCAGLGGALAVGPALVCDLLGSEALLDHLSFFFAASGLLLSALLGLMSAFLRPASLLGNGDGDDDDALLFQAGKSDGDGDASGDSSVPQGGLTTLELKALLMVAVLSVAASIAVAAAVVASAAEAAEAEERASGGNEGGLWPGSDGFQEGGSPDEPLGGDATSSSRNPAASVVVPTGAVAGRDFGHTRGRQEWAAAASEISRGM